MTFAFADPHKGHAIRAIHISRAKQLAKRFVSGAFGQHVDIRERH
jgi:hypothetical protein